MDFGGILDGVEDFVLGSDAERGASLLSRTEGIFQKSLSVGSMFGAAGDMVDVRTAITGEDQLGNRVSGVDRWLSALGAATVGGALLGSAAMASRGLPSSSLLGRGMRRPSNLPEVPPMGFVPDAAPVPSARIRNVPDSPLSNPSTVFGGTSSHTSKYLTMDFDEVIPGDGSMPRAAGWQQMADTALGYRYSPGFGNPELPPSEAAAGFLEGILAPRLATEVPSLSTYVAQTGDQSAAMRHTAMVLAQWDATSTVRTGRVAGLAEAEWTKLLKGEDADVTVIEHAMTKFAQATDFIGHPELDLGNPMLNVAYVNLDGPEGVLALGAKNWEPIPFEEMTPDVAGYRLNQLLGGTQNSSAKGLVRENIEQLVEHAVGKPDDVPSYDVWLGNMSRSPMARSVIEFADEDEMIRAWRRNPVRLDSDRDRIASILGIRMDLLAGADEKTLTRVLTEMAEEVAEGYGAVDGQRVTALEILGIAEARGRALMRNVNADGTRRRAWRHVQWDNDLVGHLTGERTAGLPSLRDIDVDTDFYLYRNGVDDLAGWNPQPTSGSKDFQFVIEGAEDGSHKVLSRGYGGFERGWHETPAMHEGYKVMRRSAPAPVTNLDEVFDRAITARNGRGRAVLFHAPPELIAGLDEGPMLQVSTLGPDRHAQDLLVRQLQQEGIAFEVVDLASAETMEIVEGVAQRGSRRTRVLQFETTEDARRAAEYLVEAPTPDAIGRAVFEALPPRPWLDGQVDNVFSEIQRLQDVQRTENGGFKQITVDGVEMSVDQRVDQLFALHHERKRAWKAEIARAIALGHVDPDDAVKRWGSFADPDWGRASGSPDNPWVDMPGEVHHVTTDAEGVAESGYLLKPRNAVDGRTGLGAGPDDSVSFTDNLAVAADIEWSMREYADLASGRKTFLELKEEALLGINADRPYWDAVVSSMGQERLDRLEAAALGEDLNRGKPGALGTEPGASYYGSEEISPEKAAVILLTDGIGYAREHAGGPMNPLFMSTNFDWMASVDPDNIKTLTYTTAPGQQGVRVQALGELRSPGTEGMKFEGITDVTPPTQPPASQIERIFGADKDPDIRFYADIGGELSSRGLTPVTERFYTDPQGRVLSLTSEMAPTHGAGASNSTVAWVPEGGRSTLPTAPDVMPMHVRTEIAQGSVERIDLDPDEPFWAARVVTIGDEGEEISRRVTEAWIETGMFGSPQPTRLAFIPEDVMDMDSAVRIRRKPGGEGVIVELMANEGGRVESVRWGEVREVLADVGFTSDQIELSTRRP